MVVLETGGTMVTIGNTQYLQPDYLSPLPTMVSSKLERKKKHKNNKLRKKK